MSEHLYQYARMQKAFYDATPQAVEDIVGNYGFHENFPYETHLLHRYGDLRKPVLAEPRRARWFENRWDAAATNSACDVAFGTADLSEVLDDFRRWFGQAEVWFHDISIGRPDPRADGRPAVLAPTHPNCHGRDDAWFTRMAFFHLREPRK